MSDYSNSCVYAIVCKNENIKDMYVGSSSNFEQRKCLHKSDCYNLNRNHYNFKVYKFIRDNGGFDNFQFEILEEVCCENKQELIERERFYVESLEPYLNIQVPGRSKKEYKKKYIEENLDKLKEYYKKYYQDHREHNKKYYQDHREEKLEYRKKYREEHRDKLKEKINCECGGRYTRPHKAEHFKSKLHQDYIKNLNIN